MSILNTLLCKYTSVKKEIWTEDFYLLLFLRIDNFVHRFCSRSSVSKWNILHACPYLFICLYICQLLKLCDQPAWTGVTGTHYYGVVMEVIFGIQYCNSGKPMLLLVKLLLREPRLLSAQQWPHITLQLLPCMPLLCFTFQIWVI